jgi:hypothetical protein
VLKLHPGELMAPWIFEVNFPYVIEFLFGTLMFAARKDRILELLTRGPVPSHHEPTYREAPYYPIGPSMASASGGACSSLNHYVGSNNPTNMTLKVHMIRNSVSWSMTGTSSPTSADASTGWDSIEDYPKHLLEPYHRGLMHQHGGHL